jgi:hypothetical protein
LAWSDESIQELLDEFVPCADEVWRLQRADTPAAKLFQEFCEEGHYGGRKKPTGTRQGIYAVTPTGELLASWNSRRVDYVKERMSAALAKWEAMSDEERLPAEALESGPRPEDHYPEDGLVLQVFTRDLPREGGESCSDWRKDAWNVDHLWMSAEEARALAEGALPEAAARRLVRLHGRDNVRGQSRSYRDEFVTAAKLTSSVVERTEGGRTLRLEGRGVVSETGRWRINDRWDGEAEHTRSFDGVMAGRATWDGERFTEFTLAWAGTRAGATQYNGRADDPGPAPMAVVFRLAPDGDRVAPSWFWDYGWR